MAWITFFSDFLCRCLLDWPQHLVLVFPFSLGVFFFQDFLKLGPLDSLLNFPTFASCPSYSDFSRSGRSHDFDPCPLFLLSFLEILCIPMASNDFPMWTFPESPASPTADWHFHGMLICLPGSFLSVTTSKFHYPLPYIHTDASSCLLIFVNNILHIHPCWKT